MPPIEKLEENTSFKAGVPIQKDGDKKPAIRKATALLDLNSLQSAIKGGEPADLIESRNSAKSLLEKLKDDEKALILARRHGFIKTGLDLITEDSCPLCDKEWKADELREHLRKKLLSAKEIENLLGQLRSNINAYLQFLSQRNSAIERVIHFCKIFEPPLEPSSLETYQKLIKNSESSLNEFLKDQSNIDPALKAITMPWWSPSQNQQEKIDECQKAITGLPDTSAEDEAREILVVAQERYERFLKATKVAKELKSQSSIAQKVLDHYNDNHKNVLEKIYDDVAQDVQ